MEFIFSETGFSENLLDFCDGVFFMVTLHV